MFTTALHFWELMLLRRWWGFCSSRDVVLCGGQRNIPYLSKIHRLQFQGLEVIEEMFSYIPTFRRKIDFIFKSRQVTEELFSHIPTFRRKIDFIFKSRQVTEKLFSHSPTFRRKSDFIFKSRQVTEELSSHPDVSKQLHLHFRVLVGHRRIVFTNSDVSKELRLHFQRLVGNRRFFLNTLTFRKNSALTLKGW